MRDQRPHKLHRVGVRISDVRRLITSPLRVLPDFMIIGGQKCGTTSLYRYLIQHPGILPARNKETRFFIDRRYSLGRLIYQASFPMAHDLRAKQVGGTEAITGESTPDYLFFPRVPERARKMVPQARLIVLLRNPVDRAYSMYHHKVRNGRETLSFEEAISREAGRIEGAKERMMADPSYRSFSFEHHSYLSRGIYVDQLMAWMAHFPRERFLILRSEDLYEDPPKIVGQSLEFLGLTDPGYVTYEQHNVGGYKKRMAPALRERLIGYFKPHNEKLYEYLGRDFGWDR